MMPASVRVFFFVALFFGAWQFVRCRTQNHVGLLLDGLSPLFAPVSSEDALCQLQSKIFLRDLARLELWAANMFDSSGKFPSGVLRGNVHVYGNYEQCLGVEAGPDVYFSTFDAAKLNSSHPTSNISHLNFDSENLDREKPHAGPDMASSDAAGPGEDGKMQYPRLQGKYCVAALELNVWEGEEREGEMRDEGKGMKGEEREMRRRLEEMLDQMQSHRVTTSTFQDRVVPFLSSNIFYWGVCIPSACAEKDVEGEMRARLAHLNQTSGYRINLQVRPGQCEVKQDLSLTLGARFTILLILAPLLLALLGWSLEGYLADSPKTASRLLRAISLRKNVKELFDVTPVAQELGCVHGIRAIFLVLLYMSHKVPMFSVVPYVNSEELASNIEQKWTIVLRSFYNYVDTFFVISGLLTSYFASKKIHQHGKLDVLKMYIRRYYKFTVLLCVVVLFTEHISPLIHNGPLVISKMRDYLKNCDGKAWTTLTYTASFEGIETMCLAPSNHLSSDMHMYLLAPFLVMALWRRPRLSSLVLLIVMATISVYKYHVILDKNISPFHYKNMPQSESTKITDILLFSSVLRFQPYLVGLALGVFFKKMDCNVHLKKPQLWLGHALCFISASYCIFAPCYTLDPGYVFHVRDGLYYALLQPLLWSIVVSWLIFVCVTGHASTLNHWLSWSGFYVVSRIAYPFNLVQLPVMLWNMSRFRTPSHYTIVSFIDLHELLLVIAVSCFLSVIYLLPLSDIWNVFTSTQPPATVRKDGKFSKTSKSLNVKDGKIKSS